MLEAKNGSMESLSIQCLESFLCRVREANRGTPEPCTIGWIAQQRMSDMRQMHADLVGATRLEAAADQAGHGRIAEALKHLVVGNGFAGRGGARHCDLLAVGGAASQAGGNRPLTALWNAPDDGQIAPLQAAVAAMGGKLLGEGLVCGVRLGHDQQAAGLLVQPVDNSRPPYPADARQAVTAMGNQGIDQRSRRVACTRVDDEACRFVDDDHICVFMDNAQRNGLAHGFGRHGQWNDDRHLVARHKLVACRGDRLALDSNLAFRNKALEPRPADIREGLGQEAVETAGGAGFGL